jgi:hypothetical protein
VSSTQVSSSKALCRSMAPSISEKIDEHLDILLKKSSKLRHALEACFALDRKESLGNVEVLVVGVVLFVTLVPFVSDGRMIPAVLLHGLAGQ